MGVDGAGVDLEGVLHNGDDGGDGGDRQHDAHQQEDHVVGLGQEGLEPCSVRMADRAAPGGGCLIHDTSLLLMRDRRSALGGGASSDSKGALFMRVAQDRSNSAQRSGDAGDGAQPALYLVQHLDPAAHGEGDGGAVLGVLQDQLALVGPPVVAVVVQGGELHGGAVLGHAAGLVVIDRLVFRSHARDWRSSRRCPCPRRRSRRRCRSCRR